MSVNTVNLLQGPAVIYSGLFGATEPTVTPGPPISLAAPTTGWTDCGATDGGVELSVNQSFNVLKVDQVVYEAERRRTGIVIEVKTALAEATLINLGVALNNTAPSTGYFIPDDGTNSAFNPAYQAILFDGIAPGGFKRRFIGRKALQTANVALAYKKDGQTLIPCTFTLHWVSTSIRPYIITDAGI